MQFLYFLESIRNPVLDFIFSTVTHIGEETVFLAVAIFFFWCVNKREGYYILTTGLIGTLINQWLKLLVRIPRPWVKHPDFTVVESAVEEATGYSFPSGHTQNVAGTFGAIGRFARRNWLRITSVAVIVLVALSRMYLGVHYPTDVLASLCVAGVLVFGFYPMFATDERFGKCMPWLIGVSAILSLGFAGYVSVIDASGLDAHNYESAVKNASTLLGCLLGLCVVYPLDRYVIGFTTGGRWYSQLVKLAVGLGIVLLLKSTLKTPLEALVGIFTDSPVYIARGLRYFLIVIFAGAVWPLSFKFFEGLRIPFMERFTEWVVSKLAKTRHAPEDTASDDN